MSWCGRPGLSWRSIAVMQNIGTEKQYFKMDDKIAQLIIEKCTINSPLEFVDNLDEIERNKNGFGSTDNIRSVTSDISEINNITLSSNINVPKLTVKCRILSGNDTLFGLQLDDQTKEDSLILINCKSGAPTAKLPRWRSQIRGACLRAISNGKSAKSIQQAMDVIKQIKYEKHEIKKYEVSLLFQTIEKIPVYPNLGTPQLYHNQLDILAEHQYELKQQADIVAQHIHHENEDDEAFKYNYEAIIRSVSSEDDKKNTFHKESVPD